MGGAGGRIEAREEARHFTREACEALEEELAAMRLAVELQANALSAALGRRQLVTPAPTEELPDPEHTTWSDPGNTGQRATSPTYTPCGFGDVRGCDVEVVMPATTAPRSLNCIAPEPHTEDVWPPWREEAVGVRWQSGLGSLLGPV
ncbi:hypothetical protein GWK47_001445 [Chionoecetes opilio]|uniref:Uncharacterized protein n=1 Tax=Chionoecetes opilio TaxID=41210 RepID=A0A8J5CLG0_CHIOP|nr:hypothetical protein GWK47_001445 [Chionoecetes opilio]